MIRLEEKELEQQVIDTNHHIAVPFELNVMADGSLDILVYSFCEGIAREFEEKFADDPTGEAAQAFLYEKITPIMAGLDYDSDDALGVIYYEFHADEGVTSEGLADCELVDDLTGEVFENLPLDEFEFLESDPCDKMAILRRDGKVVCYAGLNDVCEDDGLYEITVECEEAYRGNGYAKACVARLTEYIVGQGEQVKYLCTSDNAASIRTALSIGYKPYKSCMPFVCYKIGLDEEEGDA